jgi:hypothetical protein
VSPQQRIALSMQGSDWFKPNSTTSKLTNLQLTCMHFTSKFEASGNRSRQYWVLLLARHACGHDAFENIADKSESQDPRSAEPGTESYIFRSKHTIIVAAPKIPRPDLIY